MPIIRGRGEVVRGEWVLILTAADQNMDLGEELSKCERWQRQGFMTDMLTCSLSLQYSQTHTHTESVNL